ncbi:hypothetical protein HPP92_017960 [Vanilla planifolia]|uniref:Strictosidine synthase conserved region domain-containing protein n=1 Tax=Vanilla planifolia TaxID=51239 RepID=A0A835Q8V4_VANPL|nr:hypothetical protein HPP92_017960 [Vanilla planifolia]
MAIPSPLAHLPLLLFAALLSPFPAASSQEHAHLQKLMLTSTFGPESIAFDRHGKGPYTGVSDGRILKWHPYGDGGQWKTFAYPAQWSDACVGSKIRMESICGRPLGLQFNHVTGDLYIADAYFGLLVVGPRGGRSRPLATQADGMPFKFTNGVDVDQKTGVVYFTDSSTNFQRWEYELVVATKDATGRFMKYDPTENKLTLLASGLVFPNGVAISDDRSFVVIAGTTECRVYRYWLQGPREGELEMLAELSGYPDNIKRNTMGEFWVAMNREKIQLATTPTSMSAGVAAVKLSREGRVVEKLDAKVMHPLSEVEERNRTLWLGSVDLPYMGVYVN